MSELINRNGERAIFTIKEVGDRYKLIYQIIGGKKASAFCYSLKSAEELQKMWEYKFEKRGLCVYKFNMSVGTTNFFGLILASKKEVDRIVNTKISLLNEGVDEEVLINNDMFQLVTDKERDVDQIISLGMMGGFNPFDYEVFF